MECNMSGASIDIRHRDRLFIDGQWVAPARGGRIELVDPAIGERFDAVAGATEEDMDRAVAAARRAFDSGPWPRMGHAERGRMVQALAKQLEARHAELAAAWTRQMGGLASFAPNVTLGGTFQLNYFAGLATTYPFETRQPSSMGRAT
jgi:acyl-CoA reductase-like NAD-dependent aldehyde dehydrogenase